MARTSRALMNNNQNQSKMKSPSSGNVNQKLKSVDSLIGVSKLEIDNDTELIHEEILSPRSSLMELQRQSEVRV